METERVNFAEIDETTFVYNLLAAWNFPIFRGKKPEHLFKKLLLHCCDSCNERRASIIPCAENDSYEQVEQETENVDPAKDSNEDDETEEVNAFECCQEDKLEMHDTLANMYFNKIALPQMEFVEDFTDFLIDAGSKLRVVGFSF